MARHTAGIRTTASGPPMLPEHGGMISAVIGPCGYLNPGQKPGEPEQARLALVASGIRAIARYGAFRASSLKGT